MTQTTSVALTGETHARLCQHLLRDDGQEDLCLATYRPSSGRNRMTAILRDVILPQPGERDVHGTSPSPATTCYALPRSRRTLTAASSCCTATPG
ncbi:MAG: hypothetical protein M3488_12205, partial [Actinomycetota bacterium]|nr:hypothetical protein [Actinomycetota bacterium]